MKYKVINPIPKEDIKFLIKSYNAEGFGFHNILEEIGSGNQSIVYKYKNYAIKDYHECGYDGPILEQLQDNNIFPKLYFYTECFMVIEYLDIINAYEYYERNININQSAIDIFEYCYNKGIIPRDIHDENAIVTTNDEFKIIDVGSFGKVGNKDLDSIILEEKIDFVELDNIINHIKMPPMII